MPFQRLLESRALISAFCSSGTIAPSRSGWWRELVEGGSTGITIPTRYTVRVPASIGGRSFLVSLGFVNAVWPSSANKASAVARAP